MSLLRTLSIVVLSFSSVTAHALTAEQMLEVYSLIKQAVQSEDANSKANEYLQQLLKQNPDHPELLAYLGTTETLKGAYAWMPWNKLGYVNDGLAHIDRALRLSEKVEDDRVGNGASLKHRVQLSAAHTFLSLPEMFNTHERGNQLLGGLLAADKDEHWSKPFHASVYRAAAKRAGNEDDEAAQQAWLARADDLDGTTVAGK